MLDITGTTHGSVEYNQTYGWISHEDPLSFRPNDWQFQENGLALFLLQAIVIITLCNLLGYAFQRLLGQPRVVGDLLAGVLIGPTAFENIPGFTSTMFPTEPRSLLNLVAQVGLVSFLFLVGIETDTDEIMRHWHSVLLITVPPFAMSFAVSVGVAQFFYQELTDQTVPFTTFFVFVGTVMAVTSLSVLSRVLSELGLLSSKLGSTTIAAGAGNDALGYCLLAIGSALASGGKQINALWQLLAFCAFVLALIFIWRPILVWWIRRNGIDMSSDSKSHVSRDLILVGIGGGIASSCVSDMIGLHPLVGAFFYGVIIPHGRYGVAVTEAAETLVVLFLMPLYFGTVGLQVDFKSLNTGKVWGLIVLLLAAIFIIKFSSTTVCARLAGFSWRQGMCVGALMQSKAVIEVVISAVALQAGVINTQIFSALFLVFLITTCLVRPLARMIYLKQAEEERQQLQPPVTRGGGSIHAKDETGRSGTSHNRHWLITAALASANPSVEGVLTLINALGSDRYASQPALYLDLISVLPTEHSPASIVRSILAPSPEHAPRDPLLDILKQAARQALIPSSPAAKQHTFVVGAERMVPTILQSHRQSCHSLDESISQSLVILPWQRTSHAVRQSSYIGMLATAASAGWSKPSLLHREQNLDTEAVETRASWSSAAAESNILAGELFKQSAVASGVVIDASALSAEASDTRLASVWSGDGKLEERVGLQSGPYRHTRVVVPFFGGHDDQTAVALAQSIAQAGADVDVIIFAVAEHSTTTPFSSSADALPSQMPPHGSSLTTDNATELKEDENETVNLKTIHHEEAKRRNARFLFDAGAPIEMTEPSQALAPPVMSDPRNAVTMDGQREETVHVRIVDGVRFVTLSARNDERASNGSGVSLVMTAAVELLSDRNDMIIIGRGKRATRPRSFRQEVSDFAAQCGCGPSTDSAWYAEVKEIGVLLGAAVESALVAGSGATILVVQARSDINEAIKA